MLFLWKIDIYHYDFILRRGQTKRTPYTFCINTYDKLKIFNQQMLLIHLVLNDLCQDILIYTI